VAACGRIPLAIVIPVKEPAAVGINSDVVMSYAAPIADQGSPAIGEEQSRPIAACRLVPAEVAIGIQLPGGATDNSQVRGIRRQQLPVDDQGVGRADVDMPVTDGWHRELDGRAQGIAVPACPGAVVELGSVVRSVISAQLAGNTFDVPDN